MSAPTFQAAQGQLTQTALSEVERTRQLGARAEGEFFERALNFDPQAAAEESSRGIVGQLTPDLLRNLEFAFEDYK